MELETNNRQGINNRKYHDIPTTALFLASVELTRILFSMLGTILIARIFGASLFTDAFFLIHMLTIRLAERLRRSINITFIPVYVEYRLTRSQNELSKMTDAFASKILFYSLLGVVFFIVSSPYWLRVISAGLPSDFMSAGVKIAIILAPSLSLFILFSISESIAWSNNNYFMPSLSILLTSLSPLLGILFLHKYMGIYSVTIFTSLGFLLAFAFVFAYLRRESLHFGFTFNTRDSGTKRILENLFPIILVIVLLQLAISIDKVFALKLGEGLTSTLTYAFSISIMIPSVLAFSFYSSILPKISESYANGDSFSFSYHCIDSLKFLSFFVVPLTVFLIIFAEYVIWLLLQHGKFDVSASKYTAQALRLYGIGMPANCLWIFMLGIYMSFGRVSVLLYFSMLFLGVSGIMNYFLMEFFGYIGLPLSVSILYIFQCLCFFGLMEKELGLVLKEFKSFLLKVCLASLAMGIIVWMTKEYLLRRLNGPSGLGVLIGLCSGFLLGVIIYACISRFIGINLRLSSCKSLLGRMLE